MSEEPDFVLIGRVRRAHGTSGEVVVEPISDILERFEGLGRVLLRCGEDIREVAVSAVRRSGREMLLSLGDISDRTAAEALAGAELGVRRKDVWPLPGDTYYIFQLVGSKMVGRGGREVGVIEDILHLPANDVLVVRTAKGEALIPLTKNVVQQVDLETKTVVIEEIDGLLD